MEHSVQLGTQNYKDSIFNRLLELQKQEALPMRLKEYQQGKHWFIQCDFEIPAGEKSDEYGMITKIHRYYLANALAETILQHWEQDYVWRILRRKYKLKKDERQLVFEKALEFLEGGYSKTKNYKINRKTHLVQQILNHLETELFLDLEGFLRFRARDYKGEVDKAVTYAMDEHVLEREYLEFIELLKQFLDTQTPRLDTLHVGINSRGQFHLYNDKGVKVTSEFLDDYAVEEGSNAFSYEDLLISSLIAVAPRQIVLHICYDGYRDTLQTITHVFENRVSYCSGCKLCENL